jgi:hypothetical protein
VATRAPIIDLSFPHCWQAEVLAARPVILPARHFVYPREAEEVERGALEVLVRPSAQEETTVEVGGFPPLPQEDETQVLRLRFAPLRMTASTGQGAFLGDPALLSCGAQPFLATCALGFRDPAVPTGLWSAPHPDWLCAVSGGYAYLIDTTAPERFNMIPYRPVLEVRPVPDARLLLFVGHHAILAWGVEGEAWQSEKLSSEGVTVTGIDGGVLRGLGWELMTDKETPFTLDMGTGLRIP